MFILLFIVLPALELALLIQVGQRIGTMETLALIVLTGVVGASLARHQGLQVLRQVERELNAGRLPGSAVVDGLIILVAAALLVTPGLLTDFTGFLFLLPGTRRLVRNALLRWFAERMRRGDGHVSVRVFHAGRGGEEGPVYDVTPEPPKLPDDGDKGNPAA